jgi:hypothetical protein
MNDLQVRRSAAALFWHTDSKYVTHRAVFAGAQGSDGLTLRRAASCVPIAIEESCGRPRPGLPECDLSFLSIEETD